MNEESAAIRACEDEQQDTLTADAVADYLMNNPDFFQGRESVLMEMELPHRAGTAVSLVERQVALLRERNIESRHRLTNLMVNARDNDTLFMRTRDLVLSLLEAGSLTDLVKRVESSLRSEFGADHCRLLMVEGNGRSWQGQLNRINLDQATSTLSAIMRQSSPMVGSLRPQENAALFGDSAVTIKSAAVVAVRRQGVIALLAVGSHKSDRFHQDMGTMFLEFIGEVLARLLPPHAAKA